MAAADPAGYKIVQGLLAKRMSGQPIPGLNPVKPVAAPAAKKDFFNWHPSDDTADVSGVLQSVGLSASEVPARPVAQATTRPAVAPSYESPLLKDDPVQDNSP